MTNFSTISFKGTVNDNLDVPSFMNRPSQRAYSSQSLERTPSKDRLERSHASRSRNSHKNKKSSGKGIRGFAIGAAAAMLLNFGVAQSKSVPNVVTIPYDASSSITEIAETYNADINAILDYNNIDENTDLSSISELKIPSSYSAVQDEIQQLQNKLYNGKLSEDERNEIENQIALLQDKQALQNEIATVYTDGKYVYIQVKALSEDSSDEAQSMLAYGGINAERLKDVFDIEDGAIRRNNHISSQWKAYEDSFPEGPSGYFDYTGAFISSGDTIKVPVKAIETK